MRTAQHIFRSLTAALAATASLLLCLAVSCRRAPAPLPDDFGVTVLIDNPSSSDGTKAIADNEINSIAIFAFSGSELVGYVYESGLIRTQRQDHFPDDPQGIRSHRFLRHSQP